MTWQRANLNMYEPQGGLRIGQRAQNVFSRRELMSLSSARRFGGKSEVAAEPWLRISRVAMACSFQVIVEPAGGAGMKSAYACLDEVDRLESILSVFCAKSEVSLLNRGTTNPFPAGPELFELLKQCERVYQDTEGAFDVTTGVLSRCWGFQDRKPKLPAPEVLAATRRSVGFHLISLGEGRSISMNAPGVGINFGAIGKGYALDRGAAIIAAQGTKTAMLSAGCSSVLVLGAGPDGSGWLVGISHPVFKEQRLGTLRLRSCGMATSSQEEQSFEAGGERYGHILDPRTGFPSRGVLSVSVIADSAACADALTTAFFVGGPQLAQRYCSLHKGVVAVILMAGDMSRPVVIGSSDHVTVEVAHA